MSKYESRYQEFGYGHWSVLKTEARKERHVQCQLRDLGMETYFPMLKTFQKYRRKGQQQIEPFFPGYLFAYIERDSELFYLRGVRSLIAVVSFDGRPARLDPKVVEDLRRRENGKGYICVRPPVQELRLHTPLQIVDGPFSGHRGLFVRYLAGPQRICVLLDILKPQTLVELPLSAMATEVAPSRVTPQAV